MTALEDSLRNKIDRKTKPPGSLGRLEDIAFKIGMIQQTLTPELRYPTVLIFAGDHGLTEEGVSPYPREVTGQMVMNFLEGGAAINVFCRHNGLKIRVVDAGVDYDFPEELDLVHAKVEHGTRNVLKEPAMSTETCIRALDKGREVLGDVERGGCNVVGFGEMGIGNTSSAALLMHKFTGFPMEKCVGRGTGLDDAGVRHKTDILKQAADKYSVSDPLEIMAVFGGLEIAMMTGAMLEAKARKLTLLVDGFISTAALAAAHHMDGSIMDNTIFCHASDESGHRLMLKHLHVKPVMDMGMRLGEGTGVAVAFPVIRAAVGFLNEMASFDEAGVADRDC